MTEAKEECIHTILFGKLDGKRIPGRHRRRREVILNITFRTMCMCVDRIQLFEYVVQSLALGSKVINHFFITNGGIFNQFCDHQLPQNTWTDAVSTAKPVKLATQVRQLPVISSHTITE